MGKFATGDFPNNKELFVQTDVIMHGSFEDKMLLPCQPLPIMKKVINTVEKSLLEQLPEQKGNIEVYINGKENFKE